MAKLCAAGIQLREQIDDDYPDRDRKSDGWVADARHLAKGTSDHIPDAKSGIVRAIDIDADLSAHKEEAYALVEKIRKLAKKGDKRIKYIISQLSFYNELHHHLPKIQSKWFTNKSLGKIVKAMRIVYESGETVNPFTIRKYLDRAETILAAQLSAACSGLPSIKNQVIELQYNFVLNNIKNRVIGLNFDGGLIEAKSQLQSIIDEAQIDIGHEPKDINAVSKD